MLINAKRYEKHVVFWLGLIFFFSIAYGFRDDENTMLVLLTDHSISLPLYIFASYSIVYIFIPYFLLKRRLLLFSISAFLIILLSGLLEILKTTYISMPILFPEKDHSLDLSFFNISRAMFYIVLPAVFFTAIKYINSWYLINIQKNDLEKQHVRKELTILKSQLQPSFLIETLEILKYKAEKSPERAASGIEQVSELLSYILYEFDADKIELEKEIQLVRTYISLHELNFNSNFDIEFRLIGEFKGIYIAPMILFSMVEYLFRNISGHNDYTRIQLFLERQSRNINFWTECENCSALLVNSNDDEIILNLRKRLKLIYKKAHKFEIRQRGNKFILQLSLNVDKHR